MCCRVFTIADVTPHTHAHAHTLSLIHTHVYQAADPTHKQTLAIKAAIDKLNQAYKGKEASKDARRSTILNVVAPRAVKVEVET